MISFPRHFRKDKTAVTVFANVGGRRRVHPQRDGCEDIFRTKRKVALFDEQLGRVARDPRIDKTIERI